MAFDQFGPPEIGDWVPQADFQAEQSKEGGWTATQSFQIARATIDENTFQEDFRIGRPISELNPDIEHFWYFLGLSSIPRIRHIKGDYSIITAQFAGFTGPSGQGTDESGDPEAEPTPTFTLSGALQERDIRLHPKCLALADAKDHEILNGLYEGIYVMIDDGGVDKVAAKFIDEEAQVTYRPLPDQPTAGDAATFADLITKGQKTFLTPTFIWEKTWDSEVGLKNAEINELGFIDAPPGDPPTPNGNRNWLLQNCTQEQTGLKYRIAQQWVLSDREGWNATIYSA